MAGPGRGQQVAPTYWGGGLGMGMEPEDWVGKGERQMPMGTVGWIEVGCGGGVEIPRLRSE